MLQRCLVLAVVGLSMVLGSAVHGQAHEPDAKAVKAFVELVQAYRARPALTVKSKLRIEMGQGDLAAAGEEVPAEITFGKDLPGGLVKLRGFTCWLAEGKLYAIHEATDHSYFSMDDDGSAYYAMMNAFIDVPYPHVAIAFGDEDIEQWLPMQLYQKTPHIKPTSVADEVDLKGKPVRRLRLTSDHAELDLVYDPKTMLIDTSELKIIGGPSVQPGTKSVYKYRYEYETYEKGGLEAALVQFQPERRQRVDMLATLRPAPTQPAGGMRGGNDANPDDRGQLAGKAAPPVLLATSDGGAVDLDDLDGQVVVLDFWATWCGPCRRALPQLHDVARWASDEGLPVTVITVNVFEGRGANDNPDKRLEKVKKFWTKNEYTLPVAMDYTDETAAAYGVQGIPATFVIRSDGVVFAQHSGAGPGYADLLKEEITGAIAALEGEGE